MKPTCPQCGADLMFGDFCSHCALKKVIEDVAKTATSEIYKKPGEQMQNSKAILSSEYIKPIEKLQDFKQAAEIEEKSPYFTPMPIEMPSKSHQTLVVVGVRSNPANEQKERAQRLVTSLNNHDTIKADFVSVADGKIYPGLVWVGNNPGGVDAQELAAKCGYTQVLELNYVLDKAQSYESNDEDDEDDDFDPDYEADYDPDEAF